MKCFICGRDVNEEDDAFEQFAATDTTMCIACKNKIEQTLVKK